MTHASSDKETARESDLIMQISFQVLNISRSLETLKMPCWLDDRNTHSIKLKYIIHHHSGENEDMHQSSDGQLEEIFAIQKCLSLNLEI